MNAFLFNYYLKKQLNHYTIKYNSVVVILLKICAYAFTTILKSLIVRTKDVNPQQEKNSLKIAVRLDGGIGDILVYSLWVKELRKKLDLNCFIDVFPSKNDAINFACFKENTFVRRVYNARYFDGALGKYDLAFIFRRFPLVVKSELNRKYVSAHNRTFLSKLVKEYELFYQQNKKFYLNNARLDCAIDQYTLCKGEHRVQQPDIANLLGITTKTKPCLFIDFKNGEALLKDNNLRTYQYITVTRSVGLGTNSEHNVRFWPLSYYAKLISLLKKDFPALKIVQLGPDSCEKIPNVDVSLLGKTTLEELKVVLKYSVLHIDGECGMVHMKHFLSGTSAVIFGQTSVDYIGYPDNLNFKAKTCCPSGCEWIVDDWQTHCIREQYPPKCIMALKPEEMYVKVKVRLETILASRKDVNVSTTAVSRQELAVLLKNKKTLAYNITDENLNDIDIVFYTDDLNLAIGHHEKKFEFAPLNNLPESESKFDCIVIGKNSISDLELLECSRLLGGNRAVYLCEK